jgi:hypothetical protein
VPHDSRGVPTVPAFLGSHIFGSQRWWDKNFLLEQPAVGEVLSRFQPWDGGAPPIRRPLPQVVGEASCVADGESIASGLTINDPARFRAWPLGCFVQSPIEDFGWAANVFECQVQAWWADRVVELSDLQIGALTAALQQRFPGAAVQWWPATIFFPAVMTVVHPSYCIVQFQETQNGEQVVVEVLEGVQSPTDVGGYGSFVLFNAQAQRGLIRLSEAGADVNTPLLCIGYSYGGASAEIAAGAARLANPNRLIRFLTFGAPRPGDVRLQELIGLPTRGVALANHNDLVTTIPPDIDSILPAQIFFGLDLSNYSRWRPPHETWQLREDGSIIRNFYQTLTTQEVIDILTLAFTTGSLFGYPAHNIREYRRRLRLRCPAAPAIAAGGLGIGFGRLPGVGLKAPPAAFQPAVGLSGAELAAGKLGIADNIQPHAVGALGLEATGLPSLVMVGLDIQDVPGGALGLDAATGATCGTAIVLTGPLFQFSGTLAVGQTLWFVRPVGVAVITWRFAGLSTFGTPWTYGFGSSCATYSPNVATGNSLHFLSSLSPQNAYMAVTNTDTVPMAYTVFIT